MVYDTDYYTSRRPYSSSRPTISSYSVTPFYDHLFSDVSNFSSAYNYYNPIRVVPTYSRVGNYISRPSFKFNYDSEYAEVPYHSIKRVIPIPMTRISTSPSRIYRDRSSPMRIITPSARIFRREVNSPVRIVTSPARVVSIRVRPSVLSREFDRISSKYRSSPIGVNDTEEYLNSAYSLNFNDETRDIRASTKRLMKEIHEPVPRAQSVSRFGRASSVQPFYSRFDPDLIDKYGNALIENEVYVNKNILRPTRKTRDRIELLSNLKYHEQPRRYTVKIGLDPARASRKFNEQKPMEDPAVARKELEELKAANRLEKVKEVDEDLEKIKQKRIEERRLREEQALMEEKKKEESERQAEILRQTRLAEQAAAERQAELERKAADEARQAEEAKRVEEAQQAELARQAEEAKKANEARIAEEKRIAEEVESARMAEEAKLEAEAAKKAEEERLVEEKRLAEEVAARKAEEERLAAEEAAKKAEEERQAELEKIKAEEINLAELERIAKEEEEVELAKQANELAGLASEMAKQQTEEVQNNGADVVDNTDEVVNAVEEQPTADISNEVSSEPAEVVPTETNDSEIVEEVIADPVIEG